MITPAPPTPTPEALAAGARKHAAAAAEAARVRIEVLDHRAGIDLITDLVQLIWQPAIDDPPVTGTILRALAHSGNYCAVAFSGPKPVGVCVAFMGLDPRDALHSHLTGVVPECTSRHVGWALKLDQRAWALEREIRTVTWTFDPLVRRNAYFNLAKLGAVVRSYEVDFYGPLSDGINRGQGSDRLVVTWDLTAPPGDGEHCGGSAGGVGDPSVRAVILDERSVDRHAALRAPIHGDTPVLVGTPPDVQALRVSDPARASAWRLGMRETLGALTLSGWHVARFTCTGDYVMHLDHTTEEQT